MRCSGTVGARLGIHVRGTRDKSPEGRGTDERGAERGSDALTVQKTDDEKFV